jgi:tetratricopeptide (TPR) repeat protein
LFSSLCTLCLSGESPAALDPEIGKPYQLTVVVQVAEHPPLAAGFADQIRRELRDSLRAALGDLAHVQVTDQHPLLKEAETRGLQPALEAWPEVSEQKTHFVLIDYVDGQYEIQAGQHDGLTGLASPVARRARTPDRQLVARLAALMIDRDFGMVGTIDPNIKETEVNVTLKGAALGVPLDHWVAKDDVFAIAQVIKGSKGLRSFRVEWALLRALAEPKDGICRCQLFNRKMNPLQMGATVVGYRCLKLGTATAPLRLRLVNEADRTPLAGQAVTISANDFGPKPKEEHSTQADGTIQSKESYQNIAFVRVLDAGGDVRAKIPVAIFGDRTVDCLLKKNRQEEELGDWNSKRKRWQERIYDSHLAVNELFQELNQYLEKQQVKEALAAAQNGLKAMENEDANFRDDLAELQKTAQTAGGTQTKDLMNDLAQGERQLQELGKMRKQLSDSVADWEKALQKAQSPEARRLLTMVEQAKLLEREAKFDDAILMYEKILREPDAPPSVKDRWQKLQRQWTLKDKQHGQARSLIYNVWPKMDSATEMKAHLDEVRKAFQICKAAGDRLTPLKLLNANIALSSKLQKELDGLQGTSEGGGTKAQTIADVAGELSKLTEEIRSYMASAKK